MTWMTGSCLTRKGTYRQGPGGLTLPDTLHHLRRCPRKDVRTAHEEAVSTTFNYDPFTPSLTIFLLLNTKSEIDEIFCLTNTNPYLQKKAEIINEIYLNGVQP